jgi:hypothetical protein
LYGGYTSTTRDDFWVWKDGIWKEVDFPGPGRLSHFGMSYDIDVNALYIFGGATNGSTFTSFTDRTWMLTGGHWRELRPDISPSRRASPAMGYDPDRKRIVLYGGFDSTSNDFSDTWEWDGKAWSCLFNCE